MNMILRKAIDRSGHPWLDRDLGLGMKHDEGFATLNRIAKFNQTIDGIDVSLGKKDQKNFGALDACRHRIVRSALHRTPNVEPGLHSAHVKVFEDATHKVLFIPLVAIFISLVHDTLGNDLLT
jgi:hypothetical protein